MFNLQPYRFKTISEYHRVMRLSKPEHPLITLIDLQSIRPPSTEGPITLIYDFYTIVVKRGFHMRMKYGQQSHDFEEGVLFCMAPGQVVTFEAEPGIENNPTGWMIMIHPDFLWNTPLAKTIRQYEYFSYAVFEALHLSDKEESMVTVIANYIEQEYRANIDKFSHQVIIAQLELLLTYIERFYQRQFLTRRVTSYQLIARLEELLTVYFNSENLSEQGIPTVAYVADKLNVSAGYLSELLKALTGQSTQQHIHDKMIEKSKEQLSTTGLSVSEISYSLGFEHLQSFSKLFKTKTQLSPLAFRASFN